MVLLDKFALFKLLERPLCPFCKENILFQLRLQFIKRFYNKAVPLPDDEQLCTRYGADVRLELTPADVLRFLRAIEESGLLISVDTFTISAKDDAAAVLRFEGVVSLAVVK